MANAILSTTGTADAVATQSTASSPVGDIAMMLATMDRNGRLTGPEREALGRHATNIVDAIPLMIRGVSGALMEALNEGDCDRTLIANAIWSIDLMADTLHGMQILSADLSATTGVANHE